MDTKKTTPNDFVLKIREAYFDARKTKVFNPKTFRGRSHTISSYSEDLLADYLQQNIKNQYVYYIDQPITYKIGDESKIFYPDIAIIKENQTKTIKMIIDLKMDIGWGREKLPLYFDEKLKFINEICGIECSFNDPNKKGTKSAERVELKFDDNLKYSVVLVSDMNMSSAVRGKLKSTVIVRENIKLFVLTTDVHPNDYRLDQLDNIKINKDDFEDLVKFCE